VFWSRTRREARRQKVLDELLELDPSQRQARLELAVAAGDVRATEVEEALRLAHRLDSLRVMTFFQSSGRPAGEGLSDAVQPQADAPADPAAPAKVRKTKAPAARTKRRPASDSAVIAVVADQAPEPSIPESQAVPIEVVGLAGRLTDGELAARRYLVGSFSSRQRRLRVLAVGHSALEGAPHADGSLDSHPSETVAESRKPDISWLRP
jgi:hypothetical protein